MFEVEAREVSMEKSGRQSSVPPRQNGQDSKKEANTKGKRRSGNWRESRPKHDTAPQRRPPQQQAQKFRPSDKRPRTRGYYNDGPKQEVTDQDEADVGSLIRPGSKKQNYNHLLNFSYASRENDRGGWRGYSQSAGKRKYNGVRYNKEQFLQANCQFVVAEGEDLSIHLADPDTLVEWSLIEQVRLFGEGVPSCPICLNPPAAGKITRCGHVYCWPCMLHYLSLSEKSWAKCPICFEAVHEKDLKSVIALATPAVAPKNVITMTLMKRSRGSTYAAPVAEWSPTYSKPYNMQQEEVDTRYAKLLSARPEQIRALILEVERSELVLQLTDDDLESLDRTYIEAALTALAQREKDTASKQRIKDDIAPLMQTLSLDEDNAKAAGDKPETKPAPFVPAKPTTTYASAFSDEEEDPPAPATPAIVRTESTDSGQQTPEFIVGSGDEGTDTIKETAEGTVVGENAPKEAQNGDDTGLEAENAEEMLEAAASLAAPEEPNKPHTARQPNQVTDTYYFYQASSGQHIYLHSLNARCLVREYGSLENCPPTLTAPVQSIDPCTMTEDLRSRLKYINHLPLTCDFQVVELDLQPPVISQTTLDVFKEDIEKRKKTRKKKEQAENRKLKRMQEAENRRAEQCPQLQAALGGIQSRSHPELMSVFVPSDAPSIQRHDSGSSGLSTPVGSPPQRSPGDDGAQTTSFSYSQMLRAGKAKAQEPAKSTPAWPAMSSHTKSPDSESDNEDRVPVPQYHASFQFDIEAALTKAKGSAAAEEATGGGGGKKKKKKVKQLLFSTSMNRHQ